MRARWAAIAFFAGVVVASLVGWNGEPEQTLAPLSDPGQDALRERVTNLEREVSRLAAALEAQAERVEAPQARSLREPRVSSPVAPAPVVAEMEAAPEPEPAERAESPWRQLRARAANAAGPPAERADPYGEHGGRVRALSEALDLDLGQEETLHALLVDYDERAADLLDDAGFGASDDASQLDTALASVAEERRELDAAFDAAWIPALDANQAATYRALPADQRGVGPDAGEDALAGRTLGRLWAQP